MAGGRPTKFNKEDLEKIKLMAIKGFTDKEMAIVLDITEQTFNNWKIKHPEFFESLKEWKLRSDETVERTLFERATGFECYEDKVLQHEGQHTETVRTIKQYPPDPTSMIFWLKNRQPEKWRDKQEVEITKPMEIILKNYSGNNEC